MPSPAERAATEFADRVDSDRALAALTAYYGDPERAFTQASIDRMRRALAAARQFDADRQAILCGEATPADLATVRAVADGMNAVPEPWHRNPAAGHIWVDGYVAGRLAERIEAQS